MPRLPIDYSKGLIYKIVCKDLNIKECYYGSTTSFSKRKSSHKSNCNNINSEAYNTPFYQFIRVNGNFDNWDMILVKNYSCNNKLELLAEERRCMEQDNNRLNKELPTRTPKEWRDDNKQKSKDYYENNKQTSKDYYENNKEEILKKITCECGGKYQHCSKARHYKSKKHQKYLESI